MLVVGELVVTAVWIFNGDVKVADELKLEEVELFKLNGVFIDDVKEIGNGWLEV